MTNVLGRGGRGMTKHERPNLTTRRRLRASSGPQSLAPSPFSLFAGSNDGDAHERSIEKVSACIPNFPDRSFFAASPSYEKSVLLAQRPQAVDVGDVFVAHRVAGG